MKVIHIVTSTNVGGAQIMLLRYFTALGKSVENHSVISLVSPGPIATKIRELGVQVTDLGMPPGRVTPAALIQLRRCLRAARADIVHGWMYHGCLATWAGLVGLPKARRPAQVWAIHHSLADLRREKRTTQMVVRLLARMSPRADLITYCSNASRQQHEAVGFAANRVEVIPNAVDCKRFRPDPEARARLAEKCDIPDGRLIIGNVARAHPMKDHPGLVRAVATLLDRGHDVHLVLLGEGHRESPATALAQTLGIADRISTPGVSDEVEALVPGFDLFALSSAWGEAFPLAVCEAMACAVPCVVTDVGDCAYLVGQTGKTVPPSDPAAMADALSALIEMTGTDRHALGVAARNRVAELFSDARYVEHHDRAYETARSWPGSDRADDPYPASHNAG